MKQIHRVLYKDWEWDTETLKWTDLGKPPAIVQEIFKKRDLIIDSRNNSQMLLGLFTAFRNFLGWPDIRDQHDTEDKEYFDMLETHYKAGKIKCDIYLEEA